MLEQLRNAASGLSNRRILELFAHVGRIVSSAGSLDTILAETVSLVRATLDVERCSILIIDAEDKLLRLRAASDIPHEEWAGISVPLGHDICGKVALEGKPVLVQDIETSPYSCTAPDGRYPTSSFMSAPLIVKGATMGVINVTNRADRQVFRPEHLELMTGLAGFIALAIENATLIKSSEDLQADLQNIIESLPSAVVTVNLDRVIKLCNLRFCAMLGLNPNTRPVGAPLLSIHAPLLRDVDHMITETLESGLDCINETELHVEAQSVLIELNTTLLRDANGVVYGVLVALTDVSARRELAELRRLDSMKSDFISMISHELRTPLTSIKGASRLLASHSLDTFTDKRHELLKIVEANTDRLTRLVTDVLDAVHIENNALSIRPHHVDVARLVQSCIRVWLPVAEHKGVHVESLTEPALALVDGERIAQVVDKLLDNAIKFTPHGGCVTVRTQHTGSHIRISIRDTGCGIAPSARRKLFTRFYQFEKPLTRKAGGIGMGLYIAKAIVELHGGTITASTAGKTGAEFVVDLPIIEH